jgi:hypothetical protein
MLKMNIFEQIINDDGFEGFIKAVVDSGVNKLDMDRFIDIVCNEGGSEIYNIWLMGNSEELTKEFAQKNISDDDALLLAGHTINKFMRWFDGVQSILLGGDL